MKDFRVEEAKAIRMMVILCVLLAILSLVGCKKDAVRVDISKLCSPENEKKYVTTSGYLDDKGSIFCSNIGGGRMDCMLDVTADVGGAKVCGADTEEGSGENQIEKLPRGYKREDIKIHDNGGNVIRLSDKVTLSGQMSVTPDGSVCFMEVDKIEK